MFSTTPSEFTTRTPLLLLRLIAFAPATWSILLLIWIGARSLKKKRYAGGAIRLVEEEDDSKEVRPLLSVFITDEDILEAAGLLQHVPEAVEEDPRDVAAAAGAVLRPTPLAVVLVPLAETMTWTVVALANIVAHGGPVATLETLVPASHVFAWVSTSIRDASRGAPYSFAEKRVAP